MARRTRTALSANDEPPTEERDELIEFEGEPIRCRAVEAHQRLLRRSPEYRYRRREIRREIDQWLGNYRGAGLRTGLIRIPVVVHVVYNTPDQNISAAQIQSQIAVLNEDFRRLNADAVNTPAAFAGVAADARLEFALAVRDPNCAATTGITRTSTSVTAWTYPGDAMKSAATKGADPWPSTDYLNIWIVNYSGTTLGYGTFPGAPANIDGIVLDFQATGRSGTLMAGSHLGRTGTHEVGHWLDIFHVFDNNDGNCMSGSDNVADTPTQASASPFDSTACRTFPATSCPGNADGDMFMNYMDYSADQCLIMFTLGQVERMDAALHTARSSILASAGLVAPTGVPGPDLWSKDTSDDMGVEPNPTAQPVYFSDDIWVRRQSDGLANQDHQNPEYRTVGGAPNYVYVRVRNRACSGSQSGTVRLYWAKASSGLAWPAPWDGTVTSPALMGGAIGSAPVSVPAGDDEILVFPWSPPNPADYSSFGADQHHFCLLSRIETSATAPFGMTTPETSNLYQNVLANNNIVWKNISVVDEAPGTARQTGFLVANFGDKAQDMMIRFEAERMKPRILDWGRVLFEVPYVFAERLRGGTVKGAKWISDTQLQLTGLRATIAGGIALEPGEIFAMNAHFLSAGDATIGARVFNVDVQQFDGDALVGGVRFVLRTEPAFRPLYECGPDGRPLAGPLDGDNFFGGGDRIDCEADCGA
jgi:Pregnancy-associated plasma protein-A